MADFNSPDGSFLDEEFGSINQVSTGALNSTDMEAEPVSLFTGSSTSKEDLSEGTFAPPTDFSGSYVTDNSTGAGTFVSAADATSIFERIRFKRIDHRAAAIDRVVLQLRKGFNPDALELLPTGQQTGVDSLSAGVFA